MEDNGLKTPDMCVLAAPFGCLIVFRLKSAVDTSRNRRCRCFPCVVVLHPPQTSVRHSVIASGWDRSYWGTARATADCFVVHNPEL